MFSHCALLRAVSHISQAFLYKRSKSLIKVKRWARLAHFLGILPLRAEVTNMRPAKEFRAAREAFSSHGFLLLSFVVCFC